MAPARGGKGKVSGKAEWCSQEWVDKGDWWDKGNWDKGDWWDKGNWDKGQWWDKRDESSKDWHGMKNRWDKGGCSSQDWDGQKDWWDKGETGGADKGKLPSYSSAKRLEMKPKWPNDKLIPMEAYQQPRLAGEDLVPDASTLKAWKGAFQ